MGMLPGHRNCNRTVSISIYLSISIPILAHLLHLATVAQPTDFWSIDCGSSEIKNYTNSDSTSIEWTSDAFVWPDIGNWSTTATTVPPMTMSDQKQYITFRYFPSTNKPLNHSKFCYTLPRTIAGSYYLIRASFWYGSTMQYQTHTNNQIRFHVIVDTYIGVEIVINIPQTYPWIEEMYIRAQSSSVSVCLSAKSDSSDIPFISSLELRPLTSTIKSVEMIDYTNHAMRTVLREDSGAMSTNPSLLRYPDDIVDRLWWRFEDNATYITQTSETVDTSTISDPVPEDVMQTNFVSDSGLIITDVSQASDVLTTSTVSGLHSYCVTLWFAELDPRVNAPGQRVFDLTVEGEPFYTGLDIYNEASGLYKTVEIHTKTDRALGPYQDSIIIQAQSTPNSTYSPTMAGYEVLQLFDNAMNATAPTSPSDVGAVQDLITSTLPTLRAFIGDPCLPQGYEYSWAHCDYTSYAAPRVTSILLSDYGLEGGLPNTISNLDQLTTLDLSNNKLNGEIPGWISSLPRLTSLNLANNNFSGPIPPALLHKSGLAVFKYDGNSFLCVTRNDTCFSFASPTTEGKQHIGILVGVPLSVFITVIIIVILIIWRKNQSNDTSYPKDSVNKEEILNITKGARQFTFQEIRLSTKNFSEVLGQGGFGLVYKGILPNGLDIAVKILSNTSKQGRQEFLNEVTLLSHIHHKNLVGYVGYSIERSLVLVYEFMSNGSFYDALSRRQASQTLSWLERLRILSDAAQGLAYLHHGCNIIHRDVKSSNILLSENLQGKMSDFGLSKLTSIDVDSLTTRLVGSPGYLDPEYASTLHLTAKADIYSFGIVLLEALSGQRPLLKDKNDENVYIHIAIWARRSYERGSIEEIVDERLETNYNVSSIWKVAEIAMACLQLEGIKRPSMHHVCNDLQEAIKLESHIESPQTSDIGEVPEIIMEPSEDASLMSSQEVLSMDTYVQAR